MTRVVQVEVRRPDGVWAPVGSVSEDEPLGSIASEEPLRRRVIAFGWNGEVPGVYESVSGADVENAAVRAIATLGFELLSDLAEPYEMDVHRPNTGKMRTRFTLTET